jgi:hypothetical protein
MISEAITADTAVFRMTKRKIQLRCDLVCFSCLHAIAANISQQWLT